MNTKQEDKKYLGLPRLLAVSGFTLALSLLLIILLHGFETPQIVEVAGRINVLPKSLWLVIGEHVATALFILGAWHTIDQLVVKQEFKKEIVDYIDKVRTDLVASDTAQTTLIEGALNDMKRCIAVASHDNALGLVQSHHDANNFGYHVMIRDSHNLIAVLADGYSWIGRHAEAFSERFADSEKKTTFIFVHPDSDLIEALSRKVGMQPELYRQRIFATIKLLHELNEGRNHLEIFGHSLLSCHSVYIADKRAIFSPYFLSTQRRSPPVFELNDSGGQSFFRKLYQDIEVLKRESSPITHPSPEHSINE